MNSGSGYAEADIFASLTHLGHLSKLAVSSRSGSAKESTTLKERP